MFSSSKSQTTWFPPPKKCVSETDTFIMCLLCYKKMEIRKKHMKLTLKSSTMITNLSRHITHSSFIKRECFNSHDKQRSHTAFSLRFQGYTTNPYFVKLCGITKQALHKEREECLSYFPESIHAIFAFKVLFHYNAYTLDKSNIFLFTVWGYDVTSTSLVTLELT